jgi:membrane protein DedA with SNARE-associated domain/rhodanese-related sulfurtransferase
MGLIGVISQHGYAIVAGILFFAAVGLPLPTSVVLLAAGAAAHRGLNLAVLIPLASASALLGDSLLYLGGRYTGWWLLAGLCRLSVNPESCIFSSAEYFYRRGAKTLLFAKWIPGIAAMAAPLAGSLNMRFLRFLRLDMLGVAGYVTAWLLTGYAFSGFIRQITGWVERLGHAMLFLVVLLLIVYAVSLAIFSIKARKFDRVERISAHSLRERLEALQPDSLVVIADVRSHGYYDPGMHRIKNSIRVEPTRLHEEFAALREFMAPECEIYLYCSCIRDTTSKRVAHKLQEQDCKTKVIEGGLKAWIKAGGAVELVPETDIQHLPRFD